MVASNTDSRTIQTERAAAAAAARSGRQTRDVPMVPGFAPRSVTFGNDVKRLLRSDPISLGTYDEMRRDPAISAALTVIKAPIEGRVRDATVQCDDPAIKRALEAVFLESGLLMRLVTTSLRAYDFGVSFHEVEWCSEPLPATYAQPDPVTGTETEKPAFNGIGTWIHAIHEVNPGTVREIRRSDDGSFDGFVQRREGSDAAIEAVNSFVYANNPEFGNLWGTPLDRGAYPYWLWKQQTWRWWTGWVERKADPSRVSRHPPGFTETAPGELTPNREIALDAALALRNDAVVTLPSTFIGESGKPEWDISELVSTDRTDVFLKTKQELNSEIYLAIFAPERAFTPAQGTGTFAEAANSLDVLLLVDDGRQADWVEAVNHRLVQRQVEICWGADAPEARIVLRGLTDQEREARGQYLAKLIGTVDPTLGGALDLRDLLEAEGLPVTDEAQQSQEPQAAPPPDTGTQATPATPQAPPGVAPMMQPAPAPAAPAPALSDESAPRIDLRRTSLPDLETVARIDAHARRLAARFLRQVPDDPPETDEEEGDEDGGPAD